MSAEGPLVPSLKVLEAANCRVELDAHGDGSIDARWGFEYAANDLLQRLTHAEGDPPLLQVTEYDAQERPRTSCTQQRCARFEFSGDGELLRVDSHIASQVERDPAYELHFDDQGRLSSWQHAAGDERSGFDKYVRLLAGVPSEATYTDSFYGSEDVDTWSFFETGSLKSRTAVDDTLHHRQTCTEDGWQTLESYDDGAGVAFEVATEYVRDTTGRIAQSLTTLSGQGETHLVRADWTWNESGGAVTLATQDDETGALWSFPVVVGAGEIARDYDPQSGELLRVTLDLDGDGAPDTTDHYRYEGAGPCRDGSNPQLRPSALAMLEMPLPEGCRFSPGSQELLEAYGFGPRAVRMTP